ncbi:MAG: acetyl-CoA carboxylase carboxyltransferase subunit alpha [Candidatus Latescibacterota bacterium]|nr:MAG: acetyl-CoA carboxylase carboxyltransferase subunit alpha [Candidatus Latescibacterota bacterium]
MAEGVLDFEKPIFELEKKIGELRLLAAQGGLEAGDELRELEKKADQLRKEIFSRLTRWQRVQLARHPLRPYTLDYIERVMDEFIELHGDRLYADDGAVVGGLATFEGRKLIVLGQQKGRETKEKLARNFGMAHPEGYRKALRLMRLGEKFRIPVVTFVDTPGAYPGIQAEERGQATAIAENILAMTRVRTPMVAIIIGEGGSGGALAIAVTDRVLMMENAIYSVISPEGCAAILWSDRTMAEQAAESLKITAPDLAELSIIDGILPEPLGGAHRDPAAAAEAVRIGLRRALDELTALPLDRLLEERSRKYLRMGVFHDPGAVSRG